MTKERDPNSKRTARRNNRDFKGSRPVRRALGRAKEAATSYANQLRISRTGGAEFKKPGAQRRW